MPSRWRSPTVCGARWRTAAVRSSSCASPCSARSPPTRGAPRPHRAHSAPDGGRGGGSVVRHRPRRAGRAGGAVRALDEEASVATMLGNLLRADGFEGWLMEEALGDLVGVATERLRELSGGQYSLVLDDRVFSARPRQRRRDPQRAHAVGGRDVPRLAVARSRAGRADRRARRPRARRSWSRSSSTRGSARSIRRRSTRSRRRSRSWRNRAAGRLVTHIRDLADRMPTRPGGHEDAPDRRVVRVEA